MTETEKRLTRTNERLRKDNERLLRVLTSRSEEICELKETIIDQREMIADLLSKLVNLSENSEIQAAQIADLQRSRHRQATPFRREKGKLVKDRKKPGRKKGKGNWSRKKTPDPEETRPPEIRETQLESSCSDPNCEGEIAKGATRINHELDIPPIQPMWIQYVCETGKCKTCGKRHVARHPLQTSQATGAANVVFGPRAKALASDMKHRLGMSYGKISDFFETTFGLKVTRSGIFQSDMQLAQKAKPVYEELVEMVRGLSQVHVDETGWRIDTLSAWLWVFCGKGVTVYTIAKSRGHEVILHILGTDFKGTLTSDGFIAYDAKALEDWIKQQCLAHIQRRLKELTASETVRHVEIARTLKPIFTECLDLAKSRSTMTPEAYVEQADVLVKRLDAAIEKYISDADDDAARMVRFLKKHRDSLLRFMDDPTIEATNNPAERELRPGVITRKLGGCNRTDESAENHAILASVTQTCRRRGIDIIDFLVQLQRDVAEIPSIAAATTAAGGG